MLLIKGLLFCAVFIAALFIFKGKQPVGQLQCYIAFCLIVSLAAIILLDMDQAAWIVLVCAIALILEGDTPTKKKASYTAVAILVFAMYGVPTSEQEFEAYLEKEHRLYCTGAECVKVEKVREGEKLRVEAERKIVSDFVFHSYFIFAEGEVHLDKQKIRAVNIAGFWIPSR
ncbi:hypothetical protein [Edaphobacillus lindanitolerans]|uniref:Uncharacterized protein n=1 Tax=Edaphobacillus lindanitolerans TaxID=550447 RepID=A0A1U7PLU7_9BACI|nr:hypothetical protein [Edaphobacillus lindanitolerans]SIT88574.1 hypothetical protein SAMN05428946_2295 [Edaphobacillus lindanitolerans]